MSSCDRRSEEPCGSLIRKQTEFACNFEKMPSTVVSVMSFAGLDPGGVVPWGEPPEERTGGIYVASLTPRVDSINEAMAIAPIDLSLVDALLKGAPDLSVDGQRASNDSLAQRLSLLWFRDEVILYIGKATSLRSRVGQYYATRLGARSPHAGGWPLKVLSVLDRIWIHWAVATMPELAEQQALASFVRSVSPEARRFVHDPAHLYPYANLEGPGGRKKHGISGARAAAGPHPPRGSAPLRESGRPTSPSIRPVEMISLVQGRTQTVSDKDIERGQIRIPGESKRLFPNEPTRLTMRLRGRDVDVRWDPRFGPPARSGVLGVGKLLLHQVVAPGERLVVVINAEGVIELT